MDGCSYRRFRGLMTKHHRVQITPVAVRATFWVRERLSAGRAKSLIPARTMLHCPEVNRHDFIRIAEYFHRRTFMTGALEYVSD